MAGPDLTPLINTLMAIGDRKAQMYKFREELKLSKRKLQMSAAESRARLAQQNAQFKSTMAQKDRAMLIDAANADRTFKLNQQKADTAASTAKVTEQLKRIQMEESRTAIEASEIEIEAVKAATELVKRGVGSEGSKGKSPLDTAQKGRDAANGDSSALPDPPAKQTVEKPAPPQGGPLSIEWNAKVATETKAIQESRKPKTSAKPNLKGA